MCSRYSLTSPPEAVQRLFATKNRLNFPARYNIAPTQPVLIIRADHAGSPEQTLVRWGLIPPWVKEPKSFATLVNARAETAAEKPSFRGAIRHRRCLVPTNGFYEWTGGRGAKVPHLIRAIKSDAAPSSLMAFAGLWETWLGADGTELDTMAILTAQANTTMAPIHDRMPVILSPADYGRWLDCRAGSSLPISDLLKPAPDTMLYVSRVGPALNNVRNEGAQLWDEPAEAIGTRLI